jgi:hypothetical protein
VRGLEKLIKENLNKIIEAAKAGKVDLPENYPCRLHMHRGSFVAVEEWTNWLRPFHSEVTEPNQPLLRQVAPRVAYERSRWAL